MKKAKTIEVTVSSISSCVITEAFGGVLRIKLPDNFPQKVTLKEGATVGDAMKAAGVEYDK